MSQPPILTLSEARLGFGQEPLFKGLSINVSDGDRLCLVGRNGCGKSTLMKVIAGHVELDDGGRFLKPGKTVGYMEQDPTLAGFETLGDYARHGLEPGEDYRVDMAAEGLKLALDKTPAQASGGERRRAALANLLAKAPDLMLLDEPTNHLDIEAIAWLEDYLKTTTDAYIVISHDRAFLRKLTRGIIWIDRGVARQKAQSFDAFEEWRDKVFEEEDQERHKMKRLEKAEARWAVEGISGRRKRNMGRVRRLGELRDEISSQVKRQGAAGIQIDSGKASGKLVCDVDNVSISYDNVPIVKDFTVKIARGERVALVGPNGAGKTTLLNMLIGKTQPDSGTIKLGSNLLHALFDQSRDSVPRNITLWDAMTQDKELGVSGSNDQIMVRGQPRHVVSYLKEFLFSEAQARAPVSALSGGEVARLLLARILAQASNLLILDEPTNDLDVETLDLLQEVLDGYDGTVLLVSHDRDFLDRVATKTIAFAGDGKWVEYAGGWSDYVSQRKIVEKEQAALQKAKPKSKDKAVAEQSSKMTFSQEHRLKELPAVMERLQAEITKLEVYMSDPDLFSQEPVKFQKATDALVERHNALSDAEEEWLLLEEMAAAS